MSNFIHLRVRSSYALLESSIHVHKIRDLCIKNQMPAVGISDPNLFGALEFSETLANSGIQPIIGSTLNLTFNLNSNGNNTLITPISLLSSNESGYKNLMKLSSLSFQSNNNLPNVTISDLQKYSDGLICLSGGQKSLIYDFLKHNHKDAALDYITQIRNIFSDRFYIELQRYSNTEFAAEDQLIDIAYDQNIGIVATNDVFFEEKEDYEANNVLQCITNSDVISNPNRIHVPKDCYFKNQNEMLDLFSDLPEAIENTIVIARKSLHRPQILSPILPKFTSDMEVGEDSKGENDLLINQAKIGLEDRLAKFGHASGFDRKFYADRLESELSIIIDMDYSGYFLIVSDIINWSKNNGIPVGPGRGSGAGSLVAWSLGITDLDPIKFNLVFERFLNPHRVSLPDFDIDFCPIRREEVIDYIKNRYGNEKVAQIITFGKLQARAVIRDVGRVLELPYSQVDSLCRLIPNNPANPMTLHDAVNQIKEIKELRVSDETIDRLLDLSLSLEGLYRHASTHAAGVVISKENLNEYVPLYMDQKTNSLVTQFNMKWVEQAGLVKFDILGLKTLSVISECCKQLENIGVNVDINAISLEDQNTLRLFKEGGTSGIFQFESAGMKDLLIKAQPDNFEDLIALIALFRPGPMENIPQYLNSKKSKDQIEDLHELINPIIADTYGVIIYQEQVIQIAQKLANYSLGEADLLRRAMGKKIKSEMDAQRDKFISGSYSNGVSKERANYIFDLVDKFAGYGFNKAHSAAYALIAFQTAYLKANYPLAFMSALLTLDVGNIDKVSNIISEVKRMKINLLPPSINSSYHNFSIEESSIRFSLASIKNVGSQAVENIINERNNNGAFKNIQDFITRIDNHFVNKRALEGLILSGAFDELESNRAQLHQNIDILLSESSRLTKKRNDGQSDIFAGIDDEQNDIFLPKVASWSLNKKIAYEFEYTGSYLSGHPMEEYSSDIEKYSAITYADFLNNVKIKKHKQARLAGVIQNRVNRRGKTGRMYSFIKLSDQSQEFETMFFSDLIDRYNDELFIGNVILIKVEAETQGDSIRLKVNDVVKLNPDSKHKFENTNDNYDKVEESLEDNLINDKCNNYTIKLQNINVIDNIASKLQSGSGTDSINLIFFDKNLKKDVNLAIGNSYLLDIDTKEYLKNLPGVEIFNKE